MITGAPRLNPRSVFTTACLVGGLTVLLLTPLRTPCECPAALERVSERAELAPMKGRYLVATETMPDPTFVGARILLLEHDEGGTLGVILNRDHRAIDGGVLVSTGGPVAGHLSLAVHSPELVVEGTRRVNDTYSLSPAVNVSRAVRSGLKPAYHRIFLGYSGWAPGQLDRELAEGVWRVED